ncbi:hypothetical protein [Mucilaginibacter rubeus]|uniref:Uncharacterized protein n=1 Tax=Mucilaginibacter rubeus TaxID=2027860 RepID=A0A5C1I3P2_9SPHI|nr:hypothetical protein [Mucilaginibacter rubeus]QEM12384.1 hypothetical protein DEO27_020970 [Mucilaginibacter rubeus]
MAAIQEFEITYQGLAATVAEHSLKHGRVFHIDFAQPTMMPLVITVAYDSDDKKFWTSIPEGRQELAEEVGKLVAGYIRNKKKEICATTTVKKSPVLSLFD